MGVAQVDTALELHTGDDAGTENYTVGAAANCLIVFTSVSATVAANPGTSCTYGTQAMTQIGTANSGTGHGTAGWYLLSAGLAAASTTEIALSGFTTGEPLMFWCVSFSDVDQSTPVPQSTFLGSLGGSTLDPEADSMLVHSYGIRGERGVSTITETGAADTELLNTTFARNSDNFGGLAIKAYASSATNVATTHTFTGTNWGSGRSMGAFILRYAPAGLSGHWGLRVASWVFASSSGLWLPDTASDLLDML